MFSTSPDLMTGVLEVALGAVLFPALFLGQLATPTSPKPLEHRWWRGGFSFGSGAAADCACKAVSAAFAVATVAVGASSEEDAWTFITDV